MLFNEIHQASPVWSNVVDVVPAYNAFHKFIRFHQRLDFLDLLLDFIFVMIQQISDWKLLRTACKLQWKMDLDLKKHLAYLTACNRPA